MKHNPIKETVQKIHLSDEAKARLIAKCSSVKVETPIKSRGWVRATAIAACFVILSVSVYAATSLIHFYIEKNDDVVNVHASLDNDGAESNEPLRAWGSDNGEIMIKLNFGFMPDDLTEDATSNGKWGGERNNRAITFSAIDLRRSDLHNVVQGIDSVEEFTAGENKAYLLTSDSEIALYNNRLYVLFENEELVVQAIIGAGITIEEIKSIASGMRIEETDDVALALPIGNQFISGLDQQPDVYYITSHKIYRDELLNVGDSANYAGYFVNLDITVEQVEILDSIASLDKLGFGYWETKKIEKFTDKNGSFIPYKRTYIDRENEKFGETVEMTKRLILVTVTIEGIDTEEDERAWLHGFKLSGLKENEDGSVQASHDIRGNYVIDRTIGESAGTHEAVYKFYLGNNRYLVGYILDADECDGEMLYYDNNTHIAFSIGE